MCVPKINLQTLVNGSMGQNKEKIKYNMIYENTLFTRYPTFWHFSVIIVNIFRTIQQIELEFGKQFYLLMRYLQKAVKYVQQLRFTIFGFNISLKNTRFSRS